MASGIISRFCAGTITDIGGSKVSISSAGTITEVAPLVQVVGAMTTVNNGGAPHLQRLELCQQIQHH